MLLQNRQRDEDVEVAAAIIGPQRLPQTEHVGPFEFALVPNEQHSEEKEEVCRVGGLEVQVKLGIHELDKVVECRELLAHAGLVAEEVPLLITY